MSLQTFEGYLEKRIRTLENFFSNKHSLINESINLIVETFNAGGKLFICGNGGSAADAQHIAAEFVNGMFHPSKKHFGAVALTTDTSIITAHSNDYDFDGIFEVQLKALSSNTDCVLLLTTSGKSKNIYRAFEFCEKMKIKTIIITGENGNFASASAKVVKIPSVDTQVIQEISLIVEHYICENVIRIAH